MRDRLTALGWSEIEVIDDDLVVRPLAGYNALVRIGARTESFCVPDDEA